MQQITRRRLFRPLIEDLDKRLLKARFDVAIGLLKEARIPGLLECDSAYFVCFMFGLFDKMDASIAGKDSLNAIMQLKQMTTPLPCT